MSKTIEKVGSGELKTVAKVRAYEVWTLAVEPAKEEASE